MGIRLVISGLAVQIRPWVPIFPIAYRNKLKIIILFAASLLHCAMRFHIDHWIRDNFKKWELSAFGSR
jgi:hypothetical protein